MLKQEVIAENHLYRFLVKTTIGLIDIGEVNKGHTIIKWLFEMADSEIRNIGDADLKIVTTDAGRNAIVFFGMQFRQN